MLLALSTDLVSEGTELDRLFLTGVQGLITIAQFVHVLQNKTRISSTNSFLLHCIRGAAAVTLTHIFTMSLMDRLYSQEDT